MAWLTQIPVGLVDAHRVMMPRLRASESLREINVGVLGSGRVKEVEYKRAIERLGRAAEGVARRPKPRVKASPEALAAMGISVVVGNG